MFYKRIPKICTWSARGYYGQYAQDKFVNECIFLNEKKKIFIEIGAHDGKHLSNTYFFEKTLEWDGFCVEPRIGIQEKLKQNRRNVENVCAGVSDGVVEFTEIEDSKYQMMSGIEGFGILKKVEEWNKSSEQKLKAVQTKYPLVDINKLIKKYDFKEIDFLSIDTEGGEEEIIKHIDVKINVVTMEVFGKNIKLIDKILKSKDLYPLVDCVIDRIYVNKKSIYYKRAQKYVSKNTSNVLIF